MKKVWGLLSNVDTDVISYSKAFDLKGGTLSSEESPFEFLFTDYCTIEMNDGKELKIIQGDQEKPLPYAFWQMIGHSYANELENMLLDAGVKSVVNLDEVRMVSSKIATYQRLLVNGIRVPDTMVFFAHPNKQKIFEHFSFPFVVKPNSGFGGVGVELIHNEEEFDRYCEKLDPTTAYVAQEYISTSKGKDYRIVMLHGEYFYSMMRQTHNKDEFRSNVHLGGEVLQYTPDEDTLKLCKKIASVIDLPLIGLDLMQGDGEYVIAEINAFPGLPPEYMKKAFASVIRHFMKEQGESYDI